MVFANISPTLMQLHCFCQMPPNKGATISAVQLDYVADNKHDDFFTLLIRFDFVCLCC